MLLRGGDKCSSLSMLSRQFASVGLEARTFDDWQGTVVASGRAHQFRGVLYIRDAAREQDELGRMIVPRQDFVAENRIRSTFGFGSGYPAHPTLVTLFAFSGEDLAQETMAPVAGLLEGFIEATGTLIRQQRLFAA